MVVVVDSGGRVVTEVGTEVVVDDVVADVDVTTGMVVTTGAD